MALFRRKQRPGTTRGPERADLEHLEAFARSRRGVEAYVEPRTTVTETTVALVAADGEWTRRRVAGEKAAWQLGQRLAIPVYDVAAVGYPSRMREWTARRKAAGETGPPHASPPT
ncbi:MAG: hypothetical protein NVSMB13_01880 [Mycobacteriales bacterium]